MSIQRCAHCIGGSVIFGACIACGREPDTDIQTEDEARDGLLRGVRSAVVPAVFLWLVGFILGVMVFGAWSRSW